MTFTFSLTNVPKMIVAISWCIIWRRWDENWADVGVPSADMIEWTKVSNENKCAQKNGDEKHRKQQKSHQLGAAGLTPRTRVIHSEEEGSHPLLWPRGVKQNPKFYLANLYQRIGTSVAENNSESNGWVWLFWSDQCCSMGDKKNN